jgi:DNA-binding response OmpR family regulator/TolB-like protein/Flp pilus assembly protein TadD
MGQGAIVLLVAEPSPTRELLSRALSAAGYQMVPADTLVAARAALAARQVALVAAELDPANDLALAFARDISPRIPLLALLDRPEAMTRFVAAAIRLDDAIFAPFAAPEAKARINAALARRRAAWPPSAPPATLAFSGWVLDAQAKSLTDPAGRDVHLTPAEFSLLETLARRAGRVQSRDQLLDASAGREAAPFDRTIDILIGRLRRKIEDDPASPQLIVTVPRFGYRFDGGPARHRSGASFVSRSSAPRPAVVVLPFSAAETAAETLAANFTEDLVAGLARFSDTAVIAGGVAAGQAARQLGPGPVSRELGARYTVTGSVRRKGPTLRISAHLIDATTGTHLWTERASIESAGPICDHPALERIAHALKLQLRIAEGVRAELAGEVDPAALMARGRATLLQRDSPESRQMACRFFERALSLDGMSVDAMAAWGATLARNVACRWSSDPLADERRAGELLRHARQAAPDHFDANFGLGVLLRWQGHVVEAVEILQLLTEIEPANLDALTDLGLTYTYAGCPKKALPCIERAAEIGGNACADSGVYWIMGACYQALGHAEDAVTWLLKARARNPLLPHVRLRLAAAFGQVSELDEARKELEAARAFAAPAARADFATLAVYRSQPKLQHADFIAQHGPTYYVGLCKAGMPEA